VRAEPSLVFTVMSSALRAVILPPKVGREPLGACPLGAEEDGALDLEEEAFDDVAAPATPAPSPSTAAIAPPATATRRGADQRQRALPRGCGRCAVVRAGSSLGVVCIVCSCPSV